MVKDTKPPKRPPRYNRRNGVDDQNMTRFPFFVLTPPKYTEDIATVSYELPGTHPVTRERITRHCNIVSSAKYGLPTELDGDVLMALRAFLAQRPNPDNIVYFSRYQLLEFMGWDTSARYYKRLEQSIRVWQNTTFEYPMWWNAALGEFVEVAFSPLSMRCLIGVDRKNQQDELPLNFVTFTPEYVEAIQAGQGKDTYLDIYYGLEVGAAKLMFRLLDTVCRPGKPRSFDLIQFGTQNVGIKGTDGKGKPIRPSKMKARLAAAIRDLEAKNFIEPATDEERYSTDAAGRVRINFTRTADAGPMSGMVRAMVACGMHAAQARQIDANPTITDEQIKEKIEYLQWMQQKHPQKVSKNPGGWLRNAILNDFEYIDGFQTQASKDAKRNAEQRRYAEQQKRTQAERAERDKQRQQEKEKWTVVETYLEALSEAEREAFIRDAIAEEGDLIRSMITKSKAQNGGQWDLSSGILQLPLMRHFEEHIAAA